MEDIPHLDFSGYDFHPIIDLPDQYYVHDFCFPISGVFRLIKSWCPVMSPKNDTRVFLKFKTRVKNHCRKTTITKKRPSAFFLIENLARGPPPPTTHPTIVGFS